ncbi:MAG: DUF1934 domain-containing protein [Eubacteriales bacterium]|nr:DUF1934 domain-containing protein [Eubacteriales bacterium]
MKKDVLISISGLHYGLDDENNNNEDEIEIITPATYYLRNGKHYVVYDEVVEGMPGAIKNTVKLTGDTKFEIIKTGLTNSRMVFEKDKIYVSNYETPFGEMLVGTHTKDITAEIGEESINVSISYALDINGEPLSDCEIKVNIHSVG